MNSRRTRTCERRRRQDGEGGYAARRDWSLRRLRRAIRPRDAHVRAGGAGGGLSEGAGRRGVRGGDRQPGADVRRATDAALPRGEPVAEAGRGRDLPQARGHRPYRRAQDQQRRGPGPAGEAHGQAEDHRRDRSRPARRRDGHGVRDARAGMHRLHGRGGHPPPVAERVQDAAAGRRGAARDLRQPDAEGRDQRGDTRLGDQRRDDALPDRQRRGAPPVPDDGPRLPVDHRPGGA